MGSRSNHSGGFWEGAEEFGRKVYDVTHGKKDKSKKPKKETKKAKKETDNKPKKGAKWKVPESALARKIRESNRRTKDIIKKETGF